MLAVHNGTEFGVYYWGQTNNKLWFISSYPIRDVLKKVILLLEKSPYVGSRSILPLIYVRISISNKTQDILKFGWRWTLCQAMVIGGDDWCTCTTLMVTNTAHVSVFIYYMSRCVKKSCLRKGGFFPLRNSFYADKKGQKACSRSTHTLIKTLRQSKQRKVSAVNTMLNEVLCTSTTLKL